MKIAFDAQLLIKGDKTGIGWCAENILMRMPQYLENTYQLNYFSLGYTVEQLDNVHKYTTFGYQINECTWFHHTLYRMMWNFFYVPYSFFFRKPADVTLFFNYVIPPGVKGKKIAIVYDMAYKAYPETVRKRTRRLLEIALKKSCRRADHILTISEFSKKEIIKYLNIPEDKITIMPCGVDTTLYHEKYTDEDIDRVCKKYRIQGVYLLYLGTLEPRKNIVRLLKAYAQLKQKISDTPKLVLAGRKGWMYDEIFEIVNSLNLMSDIIFTGYVDAEDAPILIKGAMVFLFPSIYEGFGMPPLEAMACGTPVLTSNTSSLPEVVGDAGVLVDPFSVDSIKDGMEKLINSKELRMELSNKGLVRSKNFSWDVSTEVFHKVIQNNLGK
ncbi:glycosyltransferase family 1 protein [Anaerocolumna sp. AGMB13025]|uniref:glycosyltransferase family 4 protein n=1 Tax=Anaerocolumna sp. AGMB13025 TaxID=3039116 RepID=UPI00241C4F06|nr:glycosyltransferase family 1 protein [Anaerocolumna sp. AGMB13025]WFR56322.1 glycosyltransferase family 1 protein [Anaerocolumna sp. AGMB13025]